MSVPSSGEDPQRPFGWYASVPEGTSLDDETEGDAPTGFRPGSTVRFSSDDTVDVPLWDDMWGDLLFNDGEELVSLGGVSQDLADEVVAWGRASQGPATPELHAEAARLIRRLEDELNGEIRFVYQP